MRWVLLLAFIHAVVAGAQEDADFGVPPTAELRTRDHAAPTPLQVPGARTIRTTELRALLSRADGTPPLLLDVIGGDGHDSLPGAVWLPGAGRGETFRDTVQWQLDAALAELTGQERSKPMVFFCTGTQCWLSYNAALRALRLGYREVYWYRGGIEAWSDAGGRLQPLRRRWLYSP